MISFYRMGTPLPGKRKEAADYANKVSDYINKEHGVACSTAIKIGGASGRIGLRATFDNMAAFEAWIEKARGDGAYTKLTAGADGVMGRSEDAVWKTL